MHLACMRMWVQSIIHTPPCACKWEKKESVFVLWGLGEVLSLVCCLFLLALHKTGKLSVTELNLHRTFGFYFLLWDRVSWSYWGWPWTHSVVHLDLNRPPVSDRNGTHSPQQTSIEICSWKDCISLYILWNESPTVRVYFGLGNCKSAQSIRATVSRVHLEEGCWDGSPGISTLLVNPQLQMGGTRTSQHDLCEEALKVRSN